MRSLGVIFLADVVGYSKMMAADEQGALDLMRGFTKDIIRPSLETYKGTMIKGLGDGWLMEFDSASNAVNCAIHWQNTVKKDGKMALRIGIHLGDIEHDEGPPADVYGDTVNIAARLESIAENGDIAVSTSVYLCLDTKVSAAFNNCGKQTLKNIATPVEVWSTGRLNEGSKGIKRDRDKPAVSILPFESGDPSVASFAHDLTESLAKYMDTKDWLDSIIQKTPSDEDYQMTGNIVPTGNNFEVNLTLKAPGGKTLWSGHTGGRMQQIGLLADTVAEQISSTVFLEIMKVKSKYNQS